MQEFINVMENGLTVFLDKQAQDLYEFIFKLHDCDKKTAQFPTDDR